MKKNTQLQNVSSKHTKAFDAPSQVEFTFGVTSQPKYTTETSSEIKCKVFIFEQYNGEKKSAPTKHTAIGDLIEKWDNDTKRKTTLEEARRWANETFHSNEGDTVRTLRLRKGWSQTQLSQELGTSQSHIARIERGTENITIETCRKLCQALGIDLTTLDQALRHQEEAARIKINNK